MGWRRDRFRRRARHRLREPHRRDFSCLWKFALLHHFADSASSVPLGRPDFLDSHRGPVRSSAANSANPGVRDYGYLSTLCQFYAKPKIALRIPPGAFRPPPRVKSALVSMTPLGERANLNVGDEKRFLEFVQNCFGQKRKTLRNNLLGIASDNKIHEALAAGGLRSDARAEQLTLTDFAELFARLL